MAIQLNETAAEDRRLIAGRRHINLARARKRSLTVIVCLLATGVFTQTAGATTRPRIPPAQAVVALLHTHDVQNRPNGTKVGFVRPTRPLTGGRTVLPVLGQTTDHRQVWLRVRLPGRALGGPRPPRTGWIKATNTIRSRIGWHIVVHLGARRVDIYWNSRRVVSFPAIVGKPSTPTPAGEYFVEENVRMPAGAAGAPFALATSDRSNVLQEFDGGPGQIALHGLDNVGGQLGTAESHGCVRLGDGDITWLAHRIAPGTPVSIS
jgi:lipoprotein-anchoring transpeptidase ErfK/SrfK